MLLYWTSHLFVSETLDTFSRTKSLYSEVAASNIIIISLSEKKFQNFAALQSWVELLIKGLDRAITRGCHFPGYYGVIKALLAVLVGASFFPQDESHDSYDFVH